MPVPTVAHMLSSSISKISFMRLMSTQMPLRSGMAPSARPEAPPRGVTGMRCSLASLRIPTTSSVPPGSTTTSGVWSAQRCNGAGAQLKARIARSCRSVSTFSSPTIFLSSAITSSVTAPYVVVATVMNSSTPFSYDV